MSPADSPPPIDPQNSGSELTLEADATPNPKVAAGLAIAESDVDGSATAYVDDNGDEVDLSAAPLRFPTVLPRVTTGRGRDSATVAADVPYY